MSEYPTGIVTGPCICGSWPGGECLKCPKTKGLDHCSVCKGARGGVRGNENVIAGIVMCDYCHSDTLVADPN